MFWPWVSALLFTPSVDTLFVLTVSATAGLAYRLPLFNHTSSHWSGSGKGIVCGFIKIRGSRQAILKAQQSPFVLVQPCVQVTLPTFSNNRMCPKSIVDFFIPCQITQFWKSVICIVKKAPTPDWTHHTPQQYLIYILLYWCVSHGFDMGPLNRLKGGPGFSAAVVDGPINSYVGVLRVYFWQMSCDGKNKERKKRVKAFKKGPSAVVLVYRDMDWLSGKTE